MAIARKPKTSTAKVNVDKLIRRGGSVAGEKGSDGKPQLLQLRLPRWLVSRIDGVLGSRLVPPSRHVWLLEAIREKLQREEEGMASSEPARKRRSG